MTSRSQPSDVGPSDQTAGLNAEPSAAWTPGPWERPYDESPFTIWGGDRMVGRAIGDSAEAEANAFLMTASPELYEALRDLLDANSFYFPVGNPWGDRARAALRKATGDAQ